MFAKFQHFSWLQIYITKRDAKKALEQLQNIDFDSLISILEEEACGDPQSQVCQGVQECIILGSNKILSSSHK